jgi:hypothetical protein
LKMREIKNVQRNIIEVKEEKRLKSFVHLWRMGSNKNKIEKGGF